jgi:N-acetylglucosamine kinase-like BadF-type ATPase
VARVTALARLSGVDAPVAPAAVLAIDGGNSKTDVALMAADGSVLAVVQGPGSCHQNIGLDEAASLLARLVAEAAAAAGIDPGVPVATHTSACLAGADLPVEVAQLTELVSGLGASSSVAVRNDTFALLRTGTDAVDAVAVVCGAGINCVGVAAGGQIARFPALGRLSGDWGGGSGLGAEALWLAVRAEDGRGSPTLLRHLVAEHFGYPTATDVGAAIHLGEIAQDRLNELAPVLMAAARAGDAPSLAVVDRLADEVTLFAAVAMRKLGLLSAPADLVLGGGVLTGSGPLVQDRIAERVAAVAPHAVIRIVTERPVVGAALLGFDALGTAPLVESAVRSGLQRTPVIR